MSEYLRARGGMRNTGAPLWLHECGHVEEFDESQLAEIGGGCDACESGSDRMDDWRPLYIAVTR